MGEITKIAFDQLIERIQDYSNGMLQQDRPEIIWLDHVDSEISRLDTEINGKILDPPDGVTLGALLAKMNDRITFWNKTGSPMTGHKWRFDRDGQVLRITEKERYGLTIPESIRINDNGTLYTRMLIHSPFLCHI